MDTSETTLATFLLSGAPVVPVERTLKVCIDRRILRVKRESERKVVG